MSGARYQKSFRSPKEATASVAKVYSDVCVQRPKEYSDYEVRWRSKSSPYMHSNGLIDVSF
jgi:hypothetical protein